MAIGNFIKNGSYTKISKFVHQRDVGSIDVELSVFTDETEEEVLLPPIVLKISRTVEAERYEQDEMAKLIAPTGKPSDMTQDEYSVVVGKYTVATEAIMSAAETKNKYALYFTKEAIYDTSNMVELLYGWCKGLPMFEGVTSV